MIKKRIIPLLLYKDNLLIKSVKFDKSRVVGYLFETLNVYKFREVDELLFIDVSDNYLEPNYELIKDISKETFIPLTVGGKIRNKQHIYNLLKSGADKVVINTIAIKNIKLVEEFSLEFGSQCIVVSTDVKKNSNNIYEVYSNSGKENTGINLYNFILELQNKKVGEIIITNINREGTMQGYDLEILENIPDNINIPIILSGGAGNLQNILDVMKNNKVSAVCISSIFHFTEITPKNIKSFLSKNNIPVRI